MKLNDKLQGQILPILNTQVAETIKAQREAFSSRLLSVLEALETMENNLDDSSPIEIEIALEGMGIELQEVTANFASEIATICGHDGALSLVRKIRGESDEEIQVRKEHRTAKLNARKEARLQRLDDKAEKAAKRAERKAEREAKQAAKQEKEPKGTNKKTGKKTNRRSK